MRLNQYKSWLEKVLPSHQRLCIAASSLLRNLLDESKIPYLEVTSRPKLLNSAIEKIKRKRYKDPKNQLTDISGIRIVTYLPQQTRHVAEIIRSTFQVDEANSQDRATALGSDKVGYRSIHFVCTLGQSRAALPEYKGLADLKFEIQVRTVLQHAWAELAHDNTFKFDAVLPADLQRKLNLHSAMLEIVDTAFQDIFDEANNYRRKLENQTIQEFSQEEIDSISVEKAIAAIAEERGIKLRNAETGSIGSAAISEISNFGLENIGDLEKLFDEDFTTHYTPNKDETPVGLLRSALMLRDIDRYFELTFPWSVMDKNTFADLSGKYGEEKVRDLVHARGLDLEEDDDDDETFDDLDF